LLHDAARIHDHDVVGHIRHHAEVMRDEDDRHAGVLLKFLQEFENLGLRRYIECGRRLVGNEHGEVTGQRHGDHDPLPHTSG
jgi:hypothetical protein